LLVVLPLCAIAVFVFVSMSEWASCHVDNVLKGHLWTPDFAPDITVSGDERSRRMDFTKLQQFKMICVTSMYTYGSPYSLSSKRAMDNLRRGPKACWQESEAMLTIAGLAGDGTPNWTQLWLDGPRQYYRVAGDCVDREDAVLRCENDACGFVQAH